MKLRLSRGRSIAGPAATVACAAFVRFSGNAAQFEYKLAHQFPLNHPFHVRSAEMGNAVRDETNGRLVITTFPNSQLGGDAAVLGQLRAGAIQFVEMGGLIGSFVPVASIGDVGFAFRSSAAALSAFDGPLGDYVRKQIEVRGVIVYPSVYDEGMRIVVSRAKPIASVADFSGFRLRVTQAKIVTDLFTTLGAAPTPLAFAEIYTSLQTRLIDGVEVPLGVVESGRFYEVAKYVTMTNHMWLGVWLLGNASAIGALPVDMRGIVARNQRRFAALERRDVAIEYEAAKKKLQSLGVTFNDIDAGPVKSKLAPYYSRWRTEFGETAWALLEKTAGPLG